tara:strand:+ start:169 stop:1785 length:1617 start_codon:yes stop_codon:yes gene_type:complete
MVGAKPVLIRKQQTRLSDFYPVSLPEVPTPRAQELYSQLADMENIPPTQTTLGEFHTQGIPKVSPLSAEQQLNMHLDELRAKTENPEDIVQQYIEDKRDAGTVVNVPKTLAMQRNDEIMRIVNPIPYTEALDKFGRLLPEKNTTPSPRFAYGLKNTPQFRDYFGRQTTLPEHFPSYHTENWLDPETGMVREGAVAPVTAVRLANSDDIMGGMAQTGGGLIPLPNTSNESYEERRLVRRPLLIESGNPPLEEFQSGYFLTSPYVADIDRAVTTGLSGANALIGVRGFGAPSGDVFQARPAGETKEGATEAVVHSRIPPERLVPFRFTDANRSGKKESIPSFLERNDLRNFFRPKTAEDFRQAIGQEKDSVVSRNQKFDYIRDHLPFMQYAPPEFEEMVDRHGLPAVLTDDEKIRFLEAMEEEDKISHRDLSSPKKQLNRKLSMLRRLGATDWYNREDDESPLSLRDITLPQSWGDQMAALRNAPPHQKSALIELFNRRFDTNYPTDFKLPPEVSDDFSQKYKQFIKENPSIPELGDLFD